MRKYIVRAESIFDNEGFSSQVFGSQILCSLYAAKLVRQGWKVYMEEL